MGLQAHLLACGQGAGLCIGAVALQAGQLAAQHMRQQRAPPAQVGGLQGRRQQSLRSSEYTCPLKWLQNCFNVSLVIK